MAPGFFLIWSRNFSVLVGKNGNEFLQKPAIHGISFPGNSTNPISINVKSSASQNHTFETLKNVQLYITGPASQIKTIQLDWPALGGGLQISFDEGKTYNTFTTTYGYYADSSTWVTLPAIAVGLNGIAGTLGPFDSASMLLRYVIPEGATQLSVFELALTADFDVI